MPTLVTSNLLNKQEQNPEDVSSFWKSMMSK